MVVTNGSTGSEMVAAIEDEEAIAFAYCGDNINSSNYYVQSPSCSSVISLSHADHQSNDHHLLLLLPSYHHSHHTHELPQQPETADEKQEEEEEEEQENIIDQQHYPSNPTVTLAGAFQLSRCSSSRASIDSLALLHHQHEQQEKIGVHVLNHNHHGHSMKTMMTIPKKFGKNVDAGDSDGDEDGEDEDENNYHDNYEYNLGWRKYFSFRTYPASSFWIFIQLLWRLFLSFTAAVLVFYVATKPPPPHFSVQVAGMKHFDLAEGVDSSGVSTNFLNCNITVGLVIDNKSQVFGLAILSPMLVDIYFGRLPFVFSQEAQIMYGKEKREKETMMTIGAHEMKEIKVNAGTTGKPMYGAGRDMEDMLRSGRGLSLLVSLSLSSYYDYLLIGWLIRPTFNHHAHCLLFLINFHDSKHPATANYMYNSTCSLLSS